MARRKDEQPELRGKFVPAEPCSSKPCDADRINKPESLDKATFDRLTICDTHRPGIVARIKAGRRRDGA